MRTIIEDGIRENGSFDKTIESLEGHSATKADLEHFKAEAEATLVRELGRLEKGVSEAAASLAAHDHPLVAEMLIDYAKGNGELDAAAQRTLRERSGPFMHGLALELLTITGPDDVVQVAPHFRAKIGDVDKMAREYAA